MRPLTPWKLVFAGIGLVLSGLGLAISGGAVAYAQDAEPAEYVGVTQCATCHRELPRLHALSRHAMALQDVNSDKSRIQADFNVGEDVRTIQFPDEAAPRAFTPDDVYYVIGSGRYVERYLYRVRRNVYAIFPAEWNALTESWQPYRAGENWPEDSSYDWVQNCAYCHTTGLNDRGRWVDDGVQCEACHGPGSIHMAEAQRAGNPPGEVALPRVRAAIVRSPDAQICGQCHSQGVAPESGLPYPFTYRPGMDLLDSAVFTLVSADDPDHWWASGHARDTNMQFNEWLLSAHAHSLDSLRSETEPVDPACLDCHTADYQFNARLAAAVEAGTRAGASPAPVTLETAQWGVTCVACHDPHSDGTYDFSLRDDPYTLCADCHRDTDTTPGLHHPVQEMFEGVTLIPTIQGIPSVHFTIDGGPRCVSCHMPRVPVESFDLATHTLVPVLPNQPGVNADGLRDTCSTCHTGLSPAAMQQFVTNSQTSTRRRLDAATAALRVNTPGWVHTALDFIEGDGSLGVHNHRYTAALLDAVEIELGLVASRSPLMAAIRPVQNPAACAECHQNEHREWLTSPHAQASLSDVFRQEFAQLRQPTYCMGCHASGYNPQTGEYLFEGVTCSSCHYTEGDFEHPPAPVVVASNSSACGVCHSGAHAPTYDEWLVGAHSRSGIDCVDCHTPHNNGLRQGDVNTTCGNCHQEALVDPVHMGEDLDCTDCHMKRELDASGIHVIRTGHSMLIDPGTCAECHGSVHLLSAVRSSDGLLSAREEVASLQEEMERLRIEAQNSTTVGILGGALGVLVIVSIGLIILRRFK